MAGLEILGILASIGGSIVGAMGQAAAVEEQAAAKEAEKAEAERVALAERAAGTHRAKEKQKELNKLLSDQRNVGAMSGGGITGTGGEGNTFAQLQGSTLERGNYLADLQIWEGEEGGKTYDRLAAQKQREANALRASKGTIVASGILGGLGSLSKLSGTGGTGGGGGSKLFYS